MIKILLENGSISITDVCITVLLALHCKKTFGQQDMVILCLTMKRKPEMPKIAYNVL